MGETKQNADDGNAALPQLKKSDVDSITITVRYPSLRQGPTVGGVSSFTVKALDLWTFLSPEDRAGLWLASQWTGDPLHPRFIGEGAPAPDPSDRGAVRMSETMAAQITWTPGAFTPYPSQAEALQAAAAVHTLMATLGSHAVRLLDVAMSRWHCVTQLPCGRAEFAEMEALLAALRAGVGVAE